MGYLDRRRRLAFVAGLLLLVLWLVVLRVASGGGGDLGSAPEAAAVAEPQQAPRTDERQLLAQSALRFVDLYLAYEVGQADPSQRRSLLQVSTPAFGRELIQDPPRSSATGAPAREWAAGVETVRVAIFDGEPAFLVGVRVVGLNGAHVIAPTLVERESSWLVAGVGA